MYAVLLCTVQRIVPIALALLLCRCTKPEDQRGATTATMAAHPVLNEVVAAGSALSSEFGGNADWLELHNPGRGLHLLEGEWYLTDDPHHLLKFELPEVSLDEQEQLVVLCDGMDVVQQQVHSSFALDADGEWIALVHARAGKTVIVDSISFSAQHADHGLAQGRLPDGTAAWSTALLPTPGAPNETVGE